MSPVVTSPQQRLALAVEKEPPSLHGLLTKLVIILDLLQQPSQLRFERLPGKIFLVEQSLHCHCHLGNIFGNFCVHMDVAQILVVPGTLHIADVSGYQI